MTWHRDDGSSEPCRHMEGLLNKAADGTAKPFALWYTLAHVARCPKCRRFFESLKTMLLGLRRAQEREPEPEVLERLAANLRAQTEAS